MGRGCEEWILSRVHSRRPSSIDMDTVGVSHGHGIMVRTELGAALSWARFVSAKSLDGGEVSGVVGRMYSEASTGELIVVTALMRRVDLPTPKSHIITSLVVAH